MAWFYLGLVLLEALLYAVGPLAVSPVELNLSDYLYFTLLLLHLLPWLALTLRSDRRWKRLAGRRLRHLHVRSLQPAFLCFRLPEILIALDLVFFLFAYIYALNANMDYIQRFMASGGAVRLALNTTQERLAAALRFFPLLLLNAFFFFYWRIKKPGATKRVCGPTPQAVWALPLVLLSAFLGTCAFPSFISLAGIFPLAFVALVPLFLVLESTPLRWGLFYGVSFGVLHGMILNHWLGTFSLITLQLVSLFFLLAYFLFLLPALWLYRRIRALRFLVFPLAWVLFEYIRSSGFLGYPWGLWGTTQYQFIPLIQIASLTGVWGLSFLVILANSSISHSLSATMKFGGSTRSRGSKAAAVAPALAVLVLLAACTLGGQLILAARSRLPVEHEVRVALIQQNSDPRKHSYRKTFDTLKHLTDRAYRRKPDLVVWSETAFVPNIRRWSLIDPARHRYAALVREFLDYQRRLGHWLLTGNDDYELVRDAGDEEVRLDYNAAVLFSPSGRRVATYRKIHLVPITESFPWKESFPGIYQALLSFDVYLWEPGERRVVFRHPKIRFSTPICFEDSFPGDIRLFVLAGAQAIVNISNDFWSLTEVEAKQHAVNALFRAVENRRVLLRATASGLTCYIDTEGVLRSQLPYYEEGYLVVKVGLREETQTFYTRWGDWFPRLAGLLFILLALFSLLPGLRERL